MRISSKHMILAGSVAASFAGFAMADLPVYVLQTFSGTGSAAVTSDRTNLSGSNANFNANFSLGYNPIAGGAGTMTVGVSAGSSGTAVVNSARPANPGDFGSGYTRVVGSTTEYYRNYFGTNSGTSYNPTVNFRDWNASSSSSASVSGSTLGFSSGALLDTGISDYTRYRYTNNTYSTLYQGTGTPTNYRSPTSGQTTFSLSGGLEYVAATGQSMDLSSATGVEAIRLEGSGTAWATATGLAFFTFSLTDINGRTSRYDWQVLDGEALGSFETPMFAVNQDAVTNEWLDMSQITRMNIGFWSWGQASGRDSVLNANGFSYNVSQVSLVGYSVPAPGAVALVGLAGLIGGRRRKA